MPGAPDPGKIKRREHQSGLTPVAPHPAPPIFVPEISPPEALNIGYAPATPRLTVPIPSTNRTPPTSPQLRTAKQDPKLLAINHHRLERRQIRALRQHIDLIANIPL